MSVRPTRPRRLLLARPRGYCAGVERAVETVEQMLVLHGPPIYVRKQIVHNIHVVRRLEQQGAIFVESEDDVPEGATVVLSAHGVAPEVHRNAAAAAPARDRRDLPARDQGAQRGAALRGPGLHDLPDRPRRARGSRRHDGRGARRDRARADASRTSRCCRSRAPSKLAYLTQTTLSVDETTGIIAALQRALPDDRRAAQGRHLLRHDQPPGGRQVARARGRPRARDRLGELVQLAAPRRRDARPGRAGAPDRRRVADPRAVARRRRDGRHHLRRLGARVARRARRRLVPRARRRATSPSTT